MRKEIKSDVTGKIWKVELGPGSPVAEDDTVIVIDSMKMEIPVLSPEAGIIVEILVKEEDAVAEGQVVAILETSPS